MPETEIGRMTWEQMSPSNKAAYVAAHGGEPADYAGRRFRVLRKAGFAFGLRFELLP